MLHPLVITALYICWLSSHVDSALIDVDLSPEGYSYAVQTKIDAVNYTAIVDTGNFKTIYFNNSIEFNTELNNTIEVNVNGTTEKIDTLNICLALRADQSLIQYQAQYPAECMDSRTENSISTATSSANTSEATLLALENDKLHDWNETGGDVGMSYLPNVYECLSIQKDIANCTTSFMGLLLNASEDGSMVFGLDFRDNDNALFSITSEESSMQLGGIKSEYENSIDWSYQAISDIMYHRFFLQNLSFCGVKILQDYADNWPVLVDTSCTCLQLPGEVYDTFMNWFDNSKTVEDVQALPAFQFQMSTSAEPSQTFYIPLSSLIVNALAFEGEEGAPNITVAGFSEAQKLCVLRGDDIDTNNGYANPAQIQVIIGTLALRSIYFAADFTLGTVGLANKLSDVEISSFESGPSDSFTGVCSAVTTCFPSQKYVQSSNTCVDPSCSKYFFTYLDADTHDCKYERGPLLGGLIFLILIALMEVYVYLVIQSSVSELHLNRRTTPNDERGAYQRVSLGEPDIVTKNVGEFLSRAVDAVILSCHSFCCCFRCSPIVPLDNEPPADHAAAEGRRRDEVAGENPRAQEVYNV